MPVGFTIAPVAVHICGVWYPAEICVQAVVRVGVIAYNGCTWMRFTASLSRITPFWILVQRVIFSISVSLEQT
jgi:hypothetical protein